MQKKMYLLLALMIILVLVSGCKQKGLDGTWIGSESEEYSGDWTFIFSGDKLNIEAPSGAAWFKVTLSIDDKKDPKEVKIKFDDSSMYEVVGMTTMGIYKIEKNKLTLSVKEPGYSGVPTSFEKEWDTRVFVLTRKK